MISIRVWVVYSWHFHLVINASIDIMIIYFVKFTIKWKIISYF